MIFFVQTLFPTNNVNDVSGPTQNQQSDMVMVRKSTVDDLKIINER